MCVCLGKAWCVCVCVVLGWRGVCVILGEAWCVCWGRAVCVLFLVSAPYAL